MATYADVDLVQSSPELDAWIAQNISLGDLVEFRRAPRLHFLSNNLVWEDTRSDNATNCRPVKVGSLWWPRDASRFACGHFLATESQLALIRGRTSPQSGGVLQISDGTTTISPTMFLLPPRPLSQNAPDAAHLSQWTLPCPAFPSPGEPLYLITLVDIRYFWWDSSGSIVADGSTSWTAFMTAIFQALQFGVSLSIDAIPGAYQKPPPGLTSYLPYLPMLLDLCAYSVGQRICRTLDGNVFSQSATTAIGKMQGQIDANKERLAGGQMATPDLGSVTPSNVQVVFPATSPTLAPKSVKVSLSSLGLPGFAGVQTNTRTAIVRTPVAYDEANAAGMTALAKQMATDWYNWQLGKLDMVFDGIVAWSPEAMDDVEWVHTGLANTPDAKIYTRVQRQEWNPRGELLHVMLGGSDVNWVTPGASGISVFIPQGATSGTATIATGLVISPGDVIQIDAPYLDGIVVSYDPVSGVLVFDIAGGAWTLAIPPPTEFPGFSATTNLVINGATSGTWYDNDLHAQGPCWIAAVNDTSPNNFLISGMMMGLRATDINGVRFYHVWYDYDPPAFDDDPLPPSRPFVTSVACVNGVIQYTTALGLVGDGSPPAGLPAAGVSGVYGSSG